MLSPQTNKEVITAQLNNLQTPSLTESRDEQEPTDEQNFGKGHIMPKMDKRISVRQLSDDEKSQHLLRVPDVSKPDASLLFDEESSDEEKYSKQSKTVGQDS